MAEHAKITQNKNAKGWMNNIENKIFVVFVTCDLLNFVGEVQKKNE